MNWVATAEQNSREKWRLRGTLYKTDSYRRSPAVFLA
jgi:hypothetical protein